MTLGPGATLSRYRLVEEIGAGGMGVVYRAVDTLLKRHVAIKVLPPELTANLERNRRFQREARAGAAATHPNIAAIHDIEEADGVTFIVMELVEGKSLRELMGSHPLPVGDTLRIAAEIADGLAHAHRAGIVHRDLKPGNVMIGPDGRPKILDFGLARLLDDRGDLPLSRISAADTLTGELTREGKILGTAPYMSPEQARGLDTDARSDLFSFGTMLYEMVTGKRPFGGQTLMDTLSEILGRNPAPVRTLNPDVPQGLAAIIEKCLEKNPANRYQRAEDLRADLVALSLPATAAPARRAAPRRSSILVTGAGIALFLALLVAFNTERLRSLWPRSGSSGDRIESLAVLPLENLSAGEEQEYFAEGMTDALITDLSKIGALTVISRTSSNHYKGTTKPLPDIARELHVDAVIEGSVMRAGDRVRISAQLVRGATGSNLWAESYERDLKDILVLQGEVARAITEKVEVKVTPQERSRLGGRRQVNPEAYELCLRGRYSLNTGTAGEYNKALDYFKRAIETDPAHAPAYAGLADAYYEMSSVILLPEDAMPRARAAARKALEIDPDLAEAHVTLAVIISQYDWDWKGAGPAYRRAIELNPGNALAHARYGLYLNILGRLDESLVEYNLARKMDPLSASIGVLISYPYVFAPPERRRYDRALGILQEDLEMDPHYPDVHFILGLVYEKTGQIGRAIQEDQKAAEVSGEMSFYVGALGRIHAIAGDRDKAEEILDSLRKRSVREHISGYGIALIYAGLGDRDRAFEWLEKAVAERDELLTRARGDPQLDSLRDDPRFDALLRRMNLLP